LLLLSEEVPNRNDLLHQRSLLKASDPLERGTGRLDDSDKNRGGKGSDGFCSR
jgi:hypothetical protein